MIRTGRKSGVYEIDMCNGPLMGKIIRFAIPLALSSILQLLFNAADVIVVGRYAGDTSLAAVGSVGSLNALIVNLFMGLSIGTNVLVARYYGSKDYDLLSQAVHTSVATSLGLGVILIFVGNFLARPLLELMGSPENVIDLSALYVKIFFCGMPANMFYNFGSAILRAVGDTKRPLYFLTVAGVLNVLLNLLFVIVFKMDVAGVALATIISQYVSAVLVFICLLRTDGPYRVILRRLRIHMKTLWQLVRIGLPAGMQGLVFSISNVIIQSSINSFGSVAMAGSSAGANLEGFVYVAMNAFYQAALSFTSQNLGAAKYDRLNKILASCIFLVCVVGGVFGVGVFLAGRPLVSIYSSKPSLDIVLGSMSDPASMAAALATSAQSIYSYASSALVIDYGVQRLAFLCAPYLLCGIMDVMVGSLRGSGYSLVPMIVSIIGVCGVRIVWIFTIFQMPQFHTLPVLYLSYTVSWVITAAIHFSCYVWLKKKKINPLAKAQAEAQAETQPA